jgi:hypothetical protein
MAIGVVSLVATSAGHADGFFGDQGKLLLTSGFTTIEGAGGGALAPWAVISGYGTNDSYGANAHYSDLELRDARIQSFGAAIGAFDRLEFSAARITVELTDPLGNFHIGMDVYGAKVKLLGDLLYTQDSWVPQVAIGGEYKKNDGISASNTVPGLSVTRPQQLGAKEAHRFDYYLSATKIFLAQSLLVNATVQATAANQLGLLGFGGDLKSGSSAQFEGTVAYLLLRQLAVGGEYRTRPHNLSVDSERGAWDAFIAWAPTRNISLVAGFASVGTILAPVSGDTTDHQGSYVSVQIGF